MNASLTDRKSLRDDLVYEAQDASVRAAMSGYAGDTGGLKKVVEEKRALISDFDKSHDAGVERVERLGVSLLAKRSIVRKNRELIAQRLNTIASLVDRAPSAEDSGVAAVPAIASVAPAQQVAHVPAPVPPGTATRVAQHPQRVRRVRIIRRR